MGPDVSLLRLLLLALLLQPGGGNEGSATGSCYCDDTKWPSLTKLTQIRRNLKAYNRCPNYIRFQLQVRSVCGQSQAKWVQDLMSCFDRKECGYDSTQSFHHQGHLPPPSTQMPELTDGAPPDMSSPAEIQRTQQPTLLPSGVLSLDKEVTHTHLDETTTFNSGHGSEAGDSEQQKEDKHWEKDPGAAVRTSSMVPVLSLLAIVFLLTTVLIYVLCQRKKWSQQNSPDLHFDYTPVIQDSNT